jgi:hypothetical protein
VASLAAEWMARGMELDGKGDGEMRPIASLSKLLREFQALSRREEKRKDPLHEARVGLSPGLSRRG